MTAYVYEPDNGTRIDVAARAALLAGDPGDTLEFVFNDTRVKYAVPDEHADLSEHVKALLALYDAERVRADREAPPQLGDIVVRTDFVSGEGIVIGVASDLGIRIAKTDNSHQSYPMWTDLANLRVVRRASYRTVGE